MFVKGLSWSLRLRQLVPLRPLLVGPARRACALSVLRLHTLTRPLLRTHSPGWAETFRKPFLKVRINQSFVHPPDSDVDPELFSVTDRRWNKFLFWSHFLSSGSRRNLRNDLLVAADSITNTVSSLVKELHSGNPQTTSVNKGSEC